jgi:hypothetical protein
VDDRLTQVAIDGVLATRNRLAFQATVSLSSLGTNALTLTATSPNGYVTSSTLPVLRGTIPTITAIQPPDAGKLYAGSTITVQSTAIDAENDPLQCQLLLDGIVLVPWSPCASSAWTPSISDVGLRTIEGQVRDAFGGYGSRQAEVFVVRAPTPPP